MAIKKGHIAEIKIESAAYEGKGIGKLEDRAIFVKNTAPGDVVKVRIIKKRKSFFIGDLLEVVSEGPNRIEPKCKHAGLCGGCTWQHVSYNEQLSFKRQHVTDHLHRIGGLKQITPLSTIGCDSIFGYRNKMEYTFGAKRWLTSKEINSGDEISNRDFAVGMHIPGRYDRILSLDECFLQPDFSFKIMDLIRNYAIKNAIPPFDVKTKQGYFRNIMIRNGVRTGDLMVNLVTFEDNSQIMQDLTRVLLAEFPQITTIINNVNDTFSPASEGRFQTIYHGSGFITEKIGGYSFDIDPNTFFQTNTEQAEKLYETAKQFANLKKDDLVYDLYCGVGSLSLFVSDEVHKVVGIELNPTSVEKAFKNATRNNVSNCDFVAGDMKDVFTDQIISKYGKPDVIITDPPRAGMHPDVVKTLCKLKVDRLVYVSCNSATMARDLAELSEVYDIGRVQPVDMFPQTYHIETVAELKLKS